jgi:hypothetical protein
MTNPSQLPETSGSDGRQSSEPAYAVGYGRPPKHTQFRPGKSGNKKGRPKRQRNVRTVVKETLSQPITIREGDRTRSLTKLDAIVLTMVNGSVKGDPKAQASLLAWLRLYGMTDEAPEANPSEPLTANDEALVADYLRRHGLASAPTETPQGSGATSAGTTPPDTGEAS